MGFFSRFSRKSASILSVLQEAIEQLQIGIAANLILDYSARLSLDSPGDAALLADCVLSHAINEPPCSARAQAFAKEHHATVRARAAELCEHHDVAEGLSYLYAAITLLLAIQTKDPLSEPAVQLGERATELSIAIPNTFEICGSDDARECIQAISEFSSSYRALFASTSH